MWSSRSVKVVGRMSSVMVIVIISFRLLWVSAIVLRLRMFLFLVWFFFFFSSRRRHTRFKCDWSSDVCSSDLPDGLIVGYVEADDLAAAQRTMAATEVNARWQAEMGRYFTGLDGRPADEAFALLEEVFNLEDQLARLE